MQMIQKQHKYKFAMDIQDAANPNVCIKEQGMQNHIVRGTSPQGTKTRRQHAAVAPTEVQSSTQ